MKQLLLMTFVLVISSVSFAKRAPVPLLTLQGKPEYPVRTTTAADTTFRRVERKESLIANSIGLEIGLLGRRQENGADFMGMQSFLGGRVFMVFPVASQILLKPSLGYFYKSEKSAAVSVTQKTVEAGAGLFYRALSHSGIHWDVGLSNRVHWFYSSISVYGNGENTPSTLFYRLGPATSLEINVSRGLSLIGNLELTWTFERPTRFYSGTSFGIGFDL